MIQNQLPHCVLSVNRFGFGLRLKWVTVIRSPADLTGVSAASNLSRHSGISSSNCHIIYTNIQFTCGRFFHTTFFITLQSILYHCSYRLRHISGITCALWRHYEDRDTPTGSSDWREVWLSPGGCDFVLVSEPNSDLFSEDSLPSCKWHKEKWVHLLWDDHAVITKTRVISKTKVCL